MTHVSRSTVLHFAIFLVLLSGFATVLGDETPIDFIAQADVAYATRHIEESMIQIIDLLEAVLPNLATLPVQSQSDILNRLSQLCYEPPTFSDGGDTPEDGLL